MKPQDRSPSSRRQWLIAAVAVAGARRPWLLMFWRSEAPRAAQLEAAPEAPAPRPRPPPKFTPAPHRAHRAAAEAVTPEKVAACKACEEKNRGGLCVKNMGCDDLHGEDKTLCENLRKLPARPPRVQHHQPRPVLLRRRQGPGVRRSPRGPLRAGGAGRHQDHATCCKSAERYFRPEFPSGRATQVSACHIRACKEECVGLQL